MTKPTLYGFPQSSYVWTARAALAIKGIEYDFKPIAPGEHKTPEFLGRHPYGKVPALANPDLFETSAIVRWADAAGSGPALFPKDPLAAAHVEQWISVHSSYIYKQVVLDWAFKYIFAKGEPDMAAIEAARPPIAHSLAALAEGMSGTYLVGDAISAADLFIGPMLFVLSNFDDGKALLGAQPKCQALVGALAKNAGFMSGAPPRPS